MTKKIMLIRHGKTQGNLERRYIGDQEEPLCEEGLRQIAQMLKTAPLPPVETVFCGPALRCRQTAALLFPAQAYTVLPMKEIDFGRFTGKNAEELSNDEEYSQWLETNCMGDIPGGESVIDFKTRCGKTFLSVAEECSAGTTAMVIHGGNIMAILEQFAVPKLGFYDYHIPNAGYFLCEYAGKKLTIIEKGGPL